MYKGIQIWNKLETEKIKNDKALKNKSIQVYIYIT